MSEPAAPAPQALPVRLVGTVGAVTLDVVAALGGFGAFLGDAVAHLFSPPFKWRRLLDRIHFIGFRSL
ncbi:MAG: hypothetical protein Q8Q58_13105, partial [Candidatus Rokubacteria bacterium]|nr:hypothetical protein [Candidatus Rokubacteria bacterium]